MAKKDTLINKDGVEIYPQTVTDNVFDSEGNRLDNTLAQISNDLSDIQQDLINLSALKYVDVSFSVTFSSGSAGARAFQTNKTIADILPRNSWIISQEIIWIDDSNVMIPVIFRTDTQIYLNAYRSSGSGTTGNAVRIRIYYITRS